MQLLPSFNLMEIDEQLVLRNEGHMQNLQKTSIDLIVSQKHRLAMKYSILICLKLDWIQF